MLFKKNYGELVQDALSYLSTNTNITNTNPGGITRSLIEVINKNIADYYDVLDINMSMSFLSTAEGYFLDLIGTLFNMPRLFASSASASAVDGAQKFYVTSGTLFDRITDGEIVQGITVSTVDGLVSYTVAATTAFNPSDTSVFVPIEAVGAGSKYNIGTGMLNSTNLGYNDIFTTNIKPIVSGTDTESDTNYRYRLANATLAAEKANEISVRLASLSVPGVADVIIKPYARGIGTYDVMVVPTDGIATSTLVSSVQAAIDGIQALGIKGTAIAPTVVPVDLSIKLSFVNGTTEYEKTTIRENTVTAIEGYIVNIPLGGTFIVNELRQRIMDVSAKIKDHIISCYYFREKPHFHRNVEIYWDEVFYPNPDSAQAINVI